MHKVWLESYPAAVPSEIQLTEYTSVYDILARTCAEYPDQPALRNLGVTLTYAEIDRSSRDFAAWLTSQPGLRRGTRKEWTSLPLTGDPTRAICWFHLKEAAASG